MAHNGYCYGVDMWHTLLTVVSFLTCTCQHYWLEIAKNIPNYKKQVVTTCVVFNLVCSWTLVENLVARGGFSTSDTREQKKSDLVLESIIQELDSDIKNPKCKKVKLTYTMAH